MSLVEIAEAFSTKRLLLRKPTLDDAETIYREYATDTDVTKYLSWTPHQSVDETSRFLLEQLLKWDNGDGYAWVIINKSENKLIGMMDLRINGFRAECGYVLAKSAWGQGYMTEALIATKDLAFSIASVQRFQIVCDVENPASAKVMEKAGFEKEGVLKRYFLHPNIDSIPRDCFCYSFVR